MMERAVYETIARDGQVVGTCGQHPHKTVVVRLTRLTPQQAIAACVELGRAVGLQVEVTGATS